jgi:hypothetical protein
MAVSPAENSKEADNPEDATMEESEGTLTITPGITTTIENAQELQEFELRFHIPTCQNDSIENNTQLHLQLLQILTGNFHHSDLHILNVRKHRAQDFHEPKWRNTSYYDYHYTQHDDDDANIVIAHGIQTIHRPTHLLAQLTSLVIPPSRPFFNKPRHPCPSEAGPYKLPTP